MTSVPVLLPPRRVRSALFVPTGQPRFLAGIDGRDMDAVILDLEDSVVDGGRSIARENVSAWMQSRQQGVGPVVFARINRLTAGELDDDLTAVVHPALQGVLLPKVSTVAEIGQLSEALAWHEGRRGMPLGTIRIWPLIETAEALSLIDRIAACSPRIAYLGGATAPGGDLARAVGFEVTAGGLETLFLRSQVLIAARAARVANPMTGMFTVIDDLEGFERFARESRSLGYEGLMIIHPDHIAVANAVFSPDAEAVADARSVIEALEAARRHGDGAIRHGGRMIDAAMADTAQRVLDEHDALLQRRRSAVDRQNTTVTGSDAFR
ncbi:MAG: CoA ester lyase [Ilumatobacteraceae bacterium]